MSTDKPNILFIMIDCLRADYFYRRRGPENSPNLQKILNRSTKFTNFYAVTTTTTPSTATVLTGLYPLHHGVRGHLGFRLNPEQQTIPQILQNIGYHTVARMTGPLGPETDIQRGFLDYQWREPDQVIFGKFGKQVFSELASLSTDTKPFFYFLHVWTLHMPLRTRIREGLTFRFPRGFFEWCLQILDKSVLAPVWNFYRRLRGRARKEINRQAAPVPHQGSWKDIGRRLMYHYKKTAYERNLVVLDRTLFKKLVEDIDLENTIVLIIGDHGEFVDPETDHIAREFNLKRRPNHSFHLYEYITHIPFVLFGKNTSPGKTYHKLSSQPDLGPTILALAGISFNPEQFDGENLLQDERQEKPVFIEAVGGGELEPSNYLRAVRTETWKLVESPHNPNYQEELYHLTEDPLEKNNCRREFPEIVENLRQLLASHFSEDRLFQDESGNIGTPMRPEDEDVVIARLRDLGYID